LSALHRRSVLTGCASGLLALIAALVAPALNADSAPPVPPAAERAPEVRLTAERVTLPIVMVREYPFVEGSVNGVKGKFMLDTGAEQALAINDHRVPVDHAEAIGQGHFGSGQTFAIRMAPAIQDVRIGQLSYPHATLAQSQDARQLEAITPDFIGWIGHDAWAGYALKLDYRQHTVTFYKGGPEVYLKGEKVIAKLPFETRKLPNHPLMATRIGSMNVLAAWDTGQYGALFTSADGKARLIQQTRLTPSQKKPDTFDLHGLTIDGHPLPGIPSIDVETRPFPAASSIGITEPDVLTLGFGFLSQYKTVWDYQRHCAYLLAP
jgi:hypothetical protein